MCEQLTPNFDGIPIVCLSSAGWDTDTPVNVHHIMKRLAIDHQILWMDSQPMRVPSLSRSDVGKVIRRVRSSAGGIRELQDNIWGITPRALPVSSVGLVQNWSDHRLQKAISKAIETLGFRSFILWTFLPSWAGLAGNMGEALTIYHCVDDYEANPRVNSQLVMDLERQLLGKADLVIVTSEPLLRKLEQFHRNVHLVQAGVDDGFFLDDEPPIPDDLSDIPVPRIGFTGAVSEYKVDIPLMVEAAERYPDVSFVLIGPVGAGDPNTDISKLRKQSNVYLIGSRDHDSLPDYLYHMDALMLPSPDTPTMKSSFPVKLFEYLATGKPILARAQEPLEEYASLVYLAESRVDFINGIGRVLDDNDISKRKARVEIAKLNKWEHRIIQLGKIVEETLVLKLAGDA